MANWKAQLIMVFQEVSFFIIIIKAAINYSANSYSIINVINEQIRYQSSN